MANKLYEESDIQDIADAIREMNGSSDKYTTAQYGRMIRAITSSGANVFDLVYPVGSIYMSAVEVDPSLLFGGVWEQIKDRFLLAAGDTYEAGSTGGEATHTLTKEEMPSHNHYLAGNSSGGSISFRGYINAPHSATNVSNWWAESNYVGGSQPHNNMPPYLTVHVWQRIA